MNSRIALVVMGFIAVSAIVLLALFLTKGNASSLVAKLKLIGQQPALTSEGTWQMPKELEKAQIDDKAGAKIPLDVQLIDQDGTARPLGTYFKSEDKRPVIMTLGYYGCPMLCSLVLNGLVKSLNEINFKPGKDFHIVSISIDEREKPELAKEKRKAYLGALNSDEDATWWSFHVTSADEAKRLAEAVGFNYAFDKKTDQFAHGAGFFVLSPEGILSRTLFGIEYAPVDVKLALSEAADGKIGSFIDRVLLSCFHYEPDAHRYGVYIFGVMRLGGILTVIILASLLIVYFRQEKRRMVI